MSDIGDLVKRLLDLEFSCENKCIDLKTLQFDINEGEMRLFNPFVNYFFKMDPKNPKDPKVTWAAIQFCKLMGVPYNFFAKNPEHMKRGLVNCWLPSLKPEKSTILAKLRRAKEGKDYIIRALLPAEYTNILNVDIFQNVETVIGNKYKIDFVIGDERDDLILHVRFISTEEFQVCGETCTVGFSVVASQFGASPLTVDTLLYRNNSKAAFLATYNSESFFSFDYEKIQKTDLQNMFPPLMDHLNSQLMEIKTKIQAAKELTEKKESSYNLLRELRLNKGLNDKFHIQMLQEVEKSEQEIKTRWDFVNRMSVVAKDFPVDRRLRIERAAGALIGLVFSKS